MHLFPPKHHGRALGIIDDVLSRDSQNIRCLMGRAYILQFSKKWSEAANLFKQVADLLPEDVDDGLRAKEEHAWCNAQGGDPDGGSKDFKDVLAVMETLDDREGDQARCWWRLGKCYWDMGGKILNIFILYI